MPCFRWRCWLFGHKEKYGHRWMRDNITYRIYTRGLDHIPIRQELWCMNLGEFVDVSTSVYKAYISEETHKQVAREIERQEQDEHGTLVIME
jgi:hypothetical protein